MVIAGPAWAADNDPVLVKARIVSRDPEAQQPKWECPKSNDPKVESICLYWPVSFTVDIRDVLIGQDLPRQAHAILWIDPEPSHETDLYLAGTRSPTGVISVTAWGPFTRAGCQSEIFSGDLDAENVKVLQRAGRLPCIEN
jgi:hypothetical protein